MFAGASWLAAGQASAQMAIRASAKLAADCFEFHCALAALAAAAATATGCADEDDSRFSSALACPCVRLSVRLAGRLARLLACWLAGRSQDQVCCRQRLLLALSFVLRPFAFALHFRLPLVPAARLFKRPDKRADTPAEHSKGTGKWARSHNRCQCHQLRQTNERRHCWLAGERIKLTG